jgi:hypothetical protein
MIEDDLGYCCEYAFFWLHRKTAVIAARLGVTTRAVQKHKAAMKEGCLQCQAKQNCLGPQLKKIRRR